MFRINVKHIYTYNKKECLQKEHEIEKEKKENNKTKKQIFKKANEKWR